MLHRVAAETTDVFRCHCSVETVCRTLHYNMTTVVGYREVPPIIYRSLDARVHPFHSFAGKVTTNHIACPEYLYRRVERSSVDAQTTLWRRVGPQLRVIGRTYGKRTYARLNLNELVSKTVKQLNLTIRVGSLARDIIEVNSERTYTKIVHHIKLLQQILIVLFVPLDILSRMDGPHKVYVVTVTCLYKLLNLLSLFLRIRQTPIREAVIRIVFRTVLI